MRADPCIDSQLSRLQELARLAKLDYVEQTKKDEELHTQIASERAKARYTRHYDMCADMLSEIVDVACKVCFNNMLLCMCILCV